MANPVPPIASPTALVRRGLDTIVAMALADIEADPARFKRKDEEINAALQWLSTSPEERIAELEAGLGILAALIRRGTPSSNLLEVIESLL